MDVVIRLKNYMPLHFKALNYFNIYSILNEKLSLINVEKEIETLEDLVEYFENNNEDLNAGYNKIIELIIDDETYFYDDRYDDEPKSFLRTSISNRLLTFSKIKD